MVGSIMKASAIAMLCLNAIGVSATGKPGQGRPIPGRKDCEEHDVVDCKDAGPAKNIVINGGFETAVLAPWVAVDANKDSRVVKSEQLDGRCRSSQHCYFATSNGDGHKKPYEDIFIELETTVGHTYDLTGYQKALDNTCTVQYRLGPSLDGSTIIASLTSNHGPLNWIKASGWFTATKPKSKVWVRVNCQLQCNQKRGLALDDITVVDRENPKVCTTSISTSFFPTSTTIITPTSTPIEVIPTPTPTPPTSTPIEVTPAPTPSPSVCSEEVAAVPTCAVECIKQGGASFGCAENDFECLCANIDALPGKIGGCVFGACSNPLAVVNAAKRVCECLAKPPVESPPVETPPVETPPVETPPVETPPVETPPVETPPVETPPVENPPPTPSPSVCSEEVAAVPTCAVECIKQGGASFGCAENDFECLCANIDALPGKIGGCVFGACSNPLAVVNAAKKVCECLAKPPVESPPVETPPPSSTVTTEENSPVTTSSVIVIPTPSPTGECQEWVAQGCLSDNREGRTLSRAKTQDIPEPMTNELCQDLCKADGFVFAGTEYGQECWCGNSIDNNPSASEGCIVACVGNAAETCGGPDALNLYKLSDSECVISSTTTSDSTTEASTTEASTTTSETGIVTPTPTPTPIPSVCEEEISAVPTCAVECIKEGGVSFGCAENDYECLCANIDALPGKIGGCVFGACSDPLAVVDAAKKVCECLAKPPVESPSSTSDVISSTTSESSSTETTSDVSPTTTSETSASESSTSTTAESTPTPNPSTPCQEEILAVPTCAVECIKEGGVSFGCAEDDFDCLCANIDALPGKIGGCVFGACSDPLAVVDAAKKVCECLAKPPVESPTSEITPTTTSDVSPSSTDASTTPEETKPSQTSDKTIQTSTNGPETTSEATSEFQTATITTTSVYTISSCAPTVTDCPYGSVTSTVVEYTTICPVTQSGKPSKTPVSSVQSTDAQQTTSQEAPKPTSFTTSTVYETNIYTVTSCPPTVSNCPIGQVTSTIVSHITICPVTETPSGPQPPKETKPVETHPVETKPVETPERPVSTVIVVPQPTPMPSSPAEEVPGPEETPRPENPEETPSPENPQPTTTFFSTSTSFIFTTVPPQPTGQTTLVPVVVPTSTSTASPSEIPEVPEVPEVTPEVPSPTPETPSPTPAPEVPEESPAPEPETPVETPEVPVVPQPSQTTPPAPIFTGAAGKVSGSVGAVVVAMAAALML